MDRPDHINKVCLTCRFWGPSNRPPAESVRDRWVRGRCFNAANDISWWAELGTRFDSTCAHWKKEYVRVLKDRINKRDRECRPLFPQ